MNLKENPFGILHIDDRSSRVVFYDGALTLHFTMNLDFVHRIRTDSCSGDKCRSHNLGNWCTWCMKEPEEMIFKELLSTLNGTYVSFNYITSESKIDNISWNKSLSQDDLRAVQALLIKSSRLQRNNLKRCQRKIKKCSEMMDK